MKLERRHQPLAPMNRFVLRLLRYSLVSGSLIFVSLMIGVVGYRVLGPRHTWIDALLNASFILTGMGPVDQMEGDGAKLFASGYALFSGVVFITAAGVLMTPVLHRLLHHFHLEIDEGGHRRSGA